MTTEFQNFAREMLAQRHAETLPLVVVGHPVGGIPRAEAEALITDAVEEAVVRALIGAGMEAPAKP